MAQSQLTEGPAHVWIGHTGSSAHESDAHHRVKMQFGRRAATLLGYELQAGEVLVVYLTKDGKPQKEPVIERTLDNLDAKEVKAKWTLVQAAIRKEVKSWHDLGTFRMKRRLNVRNILDSRWVFKWKVIGGVRTVKARLTVRGFKDLQQDGLNTFAGTASPWAQKLILSIAVQREWRLVSADVGAAFLK